MKFLIIRQVQTVQIKKFTIFDLIEDIDLCKIELEPDALGNVMKKIFPKQHQW